MATTSSFLFRALEHVKIAESWNCNLHVQTLLDELRPVPGSCDYLIAAGPRALVGRGLQDAQPFRLEVFIGRSHANVGLAAHLDDADQNTIAVHGDERALHPIDLSLFIRTCIRRAPEGNYRLTWPTRFRLVDTDPLEVLVQHQGDRMFLEACHADLRPAVQTHVSDVYGHPLDVPWLYDPLDYEVMIPILREPHIRRILDLGCGSGRNAVPLENAGYEVHGVDSAPESIEICRHFVRAPERFREASAASLPFPGACFDAVLDVGCLHMLPDRVSRATAIAEVWRVLKPAGFLCGRALTPRAPDWLAAQPFHAVATGFTAAEISKTGGFNPRILASTQHLIYYQLLKIA
jgi:2-polyprenyl-3-methyl-5-hydroxy-6-metoxy-1,4-benzoquinol methylase